MTQQAPFSLTRFWLILAGIVVLVFLLNLDYTAVTMTLTPIAQELDINLNILQWLLSAYVLIWAALVIPCGKLADLYGKKKMFLIGTFIFTLGSLITALGDTIEILIFGRIVQGVGGALMSAPLYSIIFTNAPKHMQAFAIGIVASIGGFGLSIGPPLSAWIVDSFGWRWIFMVNVPVCLLVLLLSVKFIPADVKNDKPAKVNYFVAFLLISGLGLFFFGLNQVEVWGLKSPLLWGMISTGLIFLVLFYQLDHRLEKRPENQILPKAILRLKPFNAVLFLNFAVCFAMSLTLFGMNLMLQNVFEMSIPETGLFMLFLTLIMGAISPISGKIADRIGMIKPVLLGTLFLISGHLLAFFINQDNALALPATALFLNGIGFGLIFSPLNTLIFKIVPEKDMNTGAGLFTAIMMIGHTTAMIIVSSLIVFWGVYTMPDMIQNLNLGFSDLQQSQLSEIMGHAKHDLTQLSSFEGQELIEAKSLLKTLFANGFKVNVLISLILLILSGLLLFKRLKNVNLPENQST